MSKKPDLPGGPHRARLLLAASVAALLLSPHVLRAEGAKPPLGIGGLRTEYKENPLGIDARKPRLGWKLVSSGRSVRQSAYEIRVARSEAAVRGGHDLAWTSGR